MPDPCDYCDCDDVDQGTHALTCPNNDSPLCQMCGGHLLLTDFDEMTGEAIWAHNEASHCDDPVPLR